LKVLGVTFNLPMMSQGSSRRGEHCSRWSCVVRYPVFVYFIPSGCIWWQKWTLYVKAFESYGITYRCVIWTDR